MPKVIKTGAIHLRMFAGFLFYQYFLRRHKFWLHRQFSSPNSRNEEMMGDGFLLVLLLPVCFEQ